MFSIDNHSKRTKIPLLDEIIVWFAYRCMTLELQTRSEVAKDYESALRIMLDP